MNVLIGCEFSGIVRNAFRSRGHNAWSNDILPALDNSQYHIQGDVFDSLKQEKWDLAIFHPPCTYLARSGWHWVNAPDSESEPLKGQPRRQAAMKAAAFFMELLNVPVRRVAVENPRPISHVNLPTHTGDTAVGIRARGGKDHLLVAEKSAEVSSH